MAQIRIFSRGIAALTHGPKFLPEFSSWIQAGDDVEAVAGWGFKKTADKARRFARKKKLPYIALEDGFLRSVQLGRDGEQPLSLVVDPIGIYYDAHQPSQLEVSLEQGQWSQSELLDRARSVIQQLVAERLSKYNNAPEKDLWPGDDRPRVLVIDQTFGDMSVVGGMADESAFQRMLQAALEENPDSEVVVRTHPDVVAGHRKGYLGIIPDHPRLTLLTQKVSPWSVLDKVHTVYTATSLLGFEALLAGKRVRCFGLPFYAGWGLTEDETTCQRRTRKPSLDEVFAAAYLKYARYVDPISGKRCEIERIITLLSDRRRHWLQTQGNILCSGVSPWKRKFLPGFLSQVKHSVRFVANPRKAIDLAAAKGGRWALWASAETKELRTLSQQKNVPMLRIEDAFLRSVGLGSDLIQPGSLVLDDEGIYYDGSRPSRLETLLRESVFSAALLHRAECLQRTIVAAGLTKYNVGTDAVSAFNHGDKRLILVPGQVEDDASILRGSPQVRTNLDLLREVRTVSPDAYVVYKPHPDVLVGNRRGGIVPAEALRWCDEVVTDISMDNLLARVDEVHTMTSLTGFEALLRGCQVVTYGLPFYAGWGLTVDRLPAPRRGRQLTLAQLIAGTLILYPTYVDPDSGQICSVEDLLVWLNKNRGLQTLPPWKTRLIRFFQRLRQV